MSPIRKEKNILLQNHYPAK